MRRWPRSTRKASPRCASRCQARDGSRPRSCAAWHACRRTRPRSPRAVAVLGDGAELAIAAQLAGLSLPAAAAAADALVAADLFTAGEDLGFTHGLVRDAVAGDVGQHAMRAAHAQAARVLRGRGAPARRIATHLLLAPGQGDRRGDGRSARRRAPVAGTWGRDDRGDAAAPGPGRAAAARRPRGRPARARDGRARRRRPRRSGAPRRGHRGARRPGRAVRGRAGPDDGAPRPGALARSGRHDRARPPRGRRTRARARDARRARAGPHDDLHSPRCRARARGRAPARRAAVGAAGRRRDAWRGDPARGGGRHRRHGPVGRARCRRASLGRRRPRRCAGARARPLPVRGGRPGDRASARRHGGAHDAGRRPGRVQWLGDGRLPPRGCCAQPLARRWGAWPTPRRTSS